MLGCNSVSLIYESIMNHMCGITEPVSEQLMGAFVLQQYLMLILLFIFQIYIEPFGRFKSNNEQKRKQTFVDEYGEEVVQNADEDDEVGELPKSNDKPRKYSNKIRPINESVVSEDGLLDRLDSVDEQTQRGDEPREEEP